MCQSRKGILLAGEDFTQEVLAMDDMSHFCLLSVDFLSPHGFTIQMKACMLSSGAILTSLTQPHTRVASVCRVFSCSSVVTRPVEEKLFLA